MNKRRSQIDIYADILEVIDQGCRKTHIIYRANLNFGRCKRCMTDLLASGLVKVQTHSPPTWAITDLGREFLKKHKEFKRFFVPLNSKDGLR